MPANCSELFARLVFSSSSLLNVAAPTAGAVFSCAVDYYFKRSSAQENLYNPIGVLQVLFRLKDFRRPIGFRNIFSYTKTNKYYLGYLPAFSQIAAYDRRLS